MLGLIALIGLLGAPTAAPAASFDCAKSQTRIEKQVCADATLSRLDGELAAEYQAARLRAGSPTALKAKQQAWLSERDKCKASACLRAAYEARVGELRESGRARFEDLSGAIIGSCASLAALAGSNPSDCRVLESGAYGKLEESGQAYAAYCLDAAREDPGFCETSALALFDLDPRTQRAERWLQQVDTEGNGNRYSRPEILKTRDGLQLLDVPVSIPGTGAFNASMLFRRAAGRWVLVDTTSWEKELAARLPKGLAVWKGIWPDYRRMSATTGLYRSGDANCCATGGSADIVLRLEGDRIGLASVKILPPPR